MKNVYWNLRQEIRDNFAVLIDNRQFSIVKFVNPFSTGVAK